MRETEELRIDLQVLSRSGHYPSFPIKTKTHIFLATPEVVWCAVKHRQPKYVSHHVDVFKYYPEEVRLLAAIALSAGDPWEQGRYTISPWLRQEFDYSAVPPFRSPMFTAYCTQVAKRLILSPETTDLCAFPKNSYSIGSQGTEAEAIRLIEAIDVSDELLLGGLSRYLSAERLAMTYSFFEEASLFALLSLEAAFEYIRQVLAQEKGIPASFSDVYIYLREVFSEGDKLSEWFQELYENRIALVHPSSRVGEYYTAPTMFQIDCWDLLKWLVIIYRHILLGEVLEESVPG